TSGEAFVIDNQSPSVVVPNVAASADADTCGTFVNVPVTSYQDNSGTVGYLETFENLAVGKISGQNNAWQDWPGGTSGLVATGLSASGSKSLKLQGGSGVDQLLMLGDKTSGLWTLSFQMYVAAGSTAYFN